MNWGGVARAQILLTTAKSRKLCLAMIKGHGTKKKNKNNLGGYFSVAENLAFIPS